MRTALEALLSDKLNRHLGYSIFEYWVTSTIDVEIESVLKTFIRDKFDRPLWNQLHVNCSRLMYFQLLDEK